MINISEKHRNIFVLLLGFSIPLSPALTNLLCFFSLWIILAERQYTARFKLLRHNPVAVSAMLLFVLMLLGMFYTPVSFNEARLMLSKYREFLLISIFILMFHNKNTCQWGYYGFISAMIFTLFLSYFMGFTGWEIIGKGTPDNPFIFKDHIIQSMLMVLATYFLVVQSWFSQKRRGLFGILIILMIYNILFMSAGRLGYLLVFCLSILFLYQIYRLRGLFIGGLILTILSIVVYSHSVMLQERVDLIFENIQTYQQGDSDTSVGNRLEWYTNTVTLIAEKPVFGSGTGSFSYEYQKLANRLGLETTTNPHNEYLMIGMQWGVIGIALFLYFFYTVWRSSKKLTQSTHFMVQGLLLTMMVGCLFNSFWLDTTEGHIFAYLIGVFYGGLSLIKTA